MNWNRFALGVNDLLGLLLIIHLLRVRLHRIYAVFALFILFDLTASSLFAFDAVVRFVDYRDLFVVSEIANWILTFWMVYALLGALFAKLPGILRFSRYLLNGTFVVAFLFACLLARHALSAAHVTFDGSIRSLVVITFVVQPLMATVALVMFVAMLAFVLWFPVELPRNLVFFSFSFVSYFAAETALLLVRKMVDNDTLRLLSIVDMIILSGCFLFLMLKLTRDGDEVTLRLGHRWERVEQAKLISQLETVNQALIRTARQS